MLNTLIKSWVALVCLVFACLSHAQEIVVGAGLVLSGPVAAYGEDVKTGIELAVEEINKSGGILGKKLKIEYEDTGADRAKGVAIYQKFAARPEIVADIIVSSIELVAIDPVSAVTKLPVLVTGSSVPRAQFSPYTFRFSTPTDKVLLAVMTKVKALRSIKTMAVIYDSVNNGTVGEMNAAKAAAAELGIKVTATEVYSTGDQNFTAQLTNIAATKPDLLYLAGTTNEAAIILSQLKALGLKSTILGGAGLNDARIAAMGDATRDALTYFALDPQDKSPAVVNFVNAYRAKFKKAAPPAYAANGYDATMLLADAIRRAGSTEREAMRQALSTTEFVGANGPYAFKGSGDNVKPSAYIFAFGATGFERVDR